MKSEKIGYWNERWVLVETPVPTRKCNYFISDYGRMKSVEKETKKESLLKGSMVRKEFFKLNLTLKDGVRFGAYVHIFVAENFVVRKSDEHTYVNFKDRDKGNNHYKNLEWITRKELTERQIADGTFKLANKKVKPEHVKMTETKVRLLKKRLKAGKTKRKILAKNFGISTMQLSRIERGENWGHVTID